MVNQREVLIEALNNAISGVNPNILKGFSLESGQGPVSDFSRKTEFFGLKRRDRDLRNYYEQAHENDGLLDQVISELPPAQGQIMRGRPKNQAYPILGDDRHSLFGAEIKIGDERTDLAQAVASNVLWLTFSGMSRNVRADYPALPYWVVGVNQSRRGLTNNILIHPLRFDNVEESRVVGVASDDGSGRFESDDTIAGSGPTKEWGETVVKGVDRFLEVFDPSSPRPGDSLGKGRSSNRQAPKPDVAFRPLDLYQVRVGSRDLEAMETSARMLATGAMQGIVSPDSNEVILTASSEGSLSNLAGSRFARFRGTRLERINPSDPRLVRLTDEVLRKFNVWEQVASLANDFSVAKEVVAKL